MAVVDCARQHRRLGLGIIVELAPVRVFWAATGRTTARSGGHGRVWWSVMTLRGKPRNEGLALAPDDHEGLDALRAAARAAGWGV